MLIVEGELLDGYHIEQLPEFNTDDTVDMNALSAIAGMRAVWLLYIAGKWDHLEDLGVDREEVEPALKQFKHYGRRLTIRQAQQLAKKVPQLKDASTELRLAYALKQLDRKPKMTQRDDKTTQQDDMLIYHAEVDTAEKAKEIVKTHSAQIEAARGSIEAGYGRGQNGAIVMVKLPAAQNVDPANLLSGSGLRFSKVRAQVVAVPQNLGEDPRGGKANG